MPAPVRDLLAAALEHKAVDPGNLVRPISTLALSHPQGALAEPLLLRLLEDAVIRDAELERIIVDARRRMLKEPLPLPVMVAIAHQCFNAEYVFDETPEETQPRRRAAARRAEFVRGLRRLSPAVRPGAHVDRTGIESLARRQIDEPREEKRLAGTIASLGGTHDARFPEGKGAVRGEPVPALGAHASVA